MHISGNLSYTDACWLAGQINRFTGKDLAHISIGVIGLYDGLAAEDIAKIKPLLTKAGVSLRPGPSTSPSSLPPSLAAEWNAKIELDQKLLDDAAVLEE